MLRSFCCWLPMLLVVLAANFIVIRTIIFPFTFADAWHIALENFKRGFWFGGYFSADYIAMYAHLTLHIFFLIKSLFCFIVATNGYWVFILANVSSLHVAKSCVSVSGYRCLCLLLLFAFHNPSLHLTLQKYKKFQSLILLSSVS